MRYRVMGTDRDSGFSCADTIEARDERTARSIASRTMIVADLMPVRIQGQLPSGVAGKDYIICANPNCHFIGEPARKARGSVLAAILLMFLGVLPGIIYLIVYNGWTITCPRCGAKVRDDT